LRSVRRITAGAVAVTVQVEGIAPAHGDRPGHVLRPVALAALAVIVGGVRVEAAGASGCDVSTDTSGASASSAGGSSERCEPSYPDDCVRIIVAIVT
jgi:hypothetical protein